MKIATEKTLAQIVTENYQAAAIFEKYGLDFCCKGKRSLESACEEKGLSLDKVVNDLDSLTQDQCRINSPLRMSLPALADYIVNTHHSYVWASMPLLFGQLQKVASKHGAHFPEMVEVFAKFGMLKSEMEQHMLKEEQILFPAIKQLAANPAGSVTTERLTAPIDVMEEEHDHAGQLMEDIRKLTSGYTAPEEACTTFRVSLLSLQAFEENLHQHVHLENNILFPKTLELLHSKN